MLWPIYEVAPTLTVVSLFFGVGATLGFHIIANMVLWSVTVDIPHMIINSYDLHFVKGLLYDSYNALYGHMFQSYFTLNAYHALYFGQLHIMAYNMLHSHILDTFKRTDYILFFVILFYNVSARHSSYTWLVSILSNIRICKSLWSEMCLCSSLDLLLSLIQFMFVYRVN